MSDDKDKNEVRLWRTMVGGRWCYSDDPGIRADTGWEPYIARPVADDDAREERLKRAEEQRDALAQECSETEHVAREAGADESIMPFPVALHDLLTRLTDERDDATRDRDEWKARAERAEAEAAQLRARIDAETRGAENASGTRRDDETAPTPTDTTKPALKAGNGAATPP